MAHQVFISYARDEDEKTAARIREALESRGIACWMAPYSIPPGKDYAEAIIDAINAAQVMVVVISSGANASKHIINEIENADNRDIAIIPFRVENVALSKSLQYYLSRRHWLDATIPPIEARINELTDTIERLLSSPRDVRHTSTALGTIDTAIPATGSDEAVFTGAIKVRPLWFWIGLSFVSLGLGSAIGLTIIAVARILDGQAAWSRWPSPPYLVLFTFIALTGMFLIVFSRLKIKHRWFWPGITIFTYGISGVPTWTTVWLDYMSPPYDYGELTIVLGGFSVPFVVVGAFCLWRGWPQSEIKHSRKRFLNFVSPMILVCIVAMLLVFLLRLFFSKVSWLGS